jgi:hypothetical protein
MTLEHAKERAREYLRAGDLQNAVMSMMSDASKIEGRGEGYAQMAAMLGMAALLNLTHKSVSDYIEGFN